MSVPVALLCVAAYFGAALGIAFLAGAFSRWWHGPQ